MEPPYQILIPEVSLPPNQHQLGDQISHIKKFTATATETNLFELEQALINMSGEILLGEEGQCPLCQKIFNRKTSLLNHIRNHSADKKYVCGYCQKGFSQQANLRNHERIHTNDRPYVCNDCGKAFTQITNLNNHKRLHTGERPFVCIEINCGRSFAQVTNLNNHMKTHHKIQQYVCTQCSKKYHTVTQLNHHLGTHGITIKPQITPRGDYACNLCPTFFDEESQLKRHIIQRHTESKFFPCTVFGCSDGFSSKHQLNKHIQNRHPNDYQRKKASRQIPLSLLQLPGNPHYISNISKIKIEENVRVYGPGDIIKHIPLQLAGISSSTYPVHQEAFLLPSAVDVSKKVLSGHV